MNITLIAYRENGSDYAWGTMIDTTDSDLIIEHCSSEKEVVDHLATIDFEAEKQAHNDAYNSYDITILIDGVPTETAPYEKLAEPLFHAKMEQYRMEQERSEQKRLDGITSKKREQELKQLADLKEKYPNNS